MSGKTLKVTVSADTLEKLSIAFRKNGEEGVTDKDIEAILAIAVRSWSNALLGPSRPRSVTELYLGWLKEIYSCHLTAEDPSEARLYGAFGIPYGQSVYMCRVLRESQLANFRRRAVSELKLALSDRLDEARQWMDDDRGEERMSFVISKNARRELGLVLGALAASGYQARPMRSEGTMGDYVSILLCARDIERLHQEVDGLLPRINP